MKAKFKKLRKKALEKTKEGLTEQLSNRDNLIVQTVKSIDLLDKHINLMTEQLKEWYAFYFPELARIVRDNELYVKLVGEIGFKEKFSKTSVEKIAGEKKLVGNVVDASKKTVGAKLEKEDINQMITFAKQIMDLRGERNHLDNYLEKIMNLEAKNISAIIGTRIGARLIATAGSLKKLSRMPSSTIQVIGAEKALFAHLRTGSASPKYGILFQFPKLRGAPNKVRGKIARKLASKLSIAAKLDFFKGEFYGERLSKEIDQYIAQLIGGK